MKNETVRPMTDGQRKDVLATLTQSMPNGISFEDAKSILGNKGPLVSDLRHTIEKYMPSSLVNQQLLAWQKVYRDHFNIELGSVTIPAHRKGFDRLIVVAKGITIEQAYDACAKLFTCWRSTDRNLDEAIPTNDRTPVNGSYAIWVRDRIEADNELKNLSANDLKAKGIELITLRERIIMELEYFEKTGGHLDIENITLCAGSRSIFGGVPSADWDGDEFYIGVGWCSPGYAVGSLRARQVAS